jgi:ribonuclease P/MRP protein subunit POP5
MKIKRLPSMKEKKRYLTFRILSEGPVSYADMKGAVLNSVLNWMGEKGLSESGLRMIKNLWDGRKKEGWLACSPGAVDDIKVSMALIHQIGDAKVIFHVLRVSGTIKSGKEKLKHSG